MGRRIGLLLSAIAGVCVPVWAEGTPPNFANLRYDEDWSQYDPESGGTWLAPIKHVRLSDGTWLSVGGELRLRWESWDGFNFDDANDDDYLHYRGFLHTDWHFGPHWRLFLQGRFSATESRSLPGGNRESSDYDKGDLWNAFVEASYPAGDLKLTARLGRFELYYGRQRIIGPSDWSNNRRIFEGGFLQIAGGDARWKLDLLLVRPVLIDGDRFTWNDSDDNRTLGGMYFTAKVGAEGKHALDAYAFYQQRDAQALVREDLYTIGARASGPIHGNLSYEAEVSAQFGEREISGQFFDDTLDIETFFAALELKYTFAQAWGKPYLLLGADYATGDGDPADDQIGTVVPLYATGHSQLGYVDTVSRQNIQSIRLGAGATLVPNKLTAAAEWYWFWRADEADALYNASGALVRAARFVTPGGRTVTAQENEIGQELDLLLTYNINRHLSLLAGYSHFFAGDFLEKTGKSDDVDFYYVQTRLQF